MAIPDSELIAIEAGHQIDLIRVGNSLGAGVNPKLSKLSKYVREVLLQWETLDTIKKRDEAIKLISAEMQKELGVYTDELTTDLRKIVSEEVSFQYNVAKGAVGSGVAMTKPTIKDTLKLINQKPMVLNGKSFSVDERIGDYTPSQIKAVKQVIVAGWSDGLTTRQISQNITGTKTVKGVFQQSQRSAYMMAKDITSHISSQTKAKVGQKNSDIIIGEKIITVLDSKTSDICKWYGSQDSGGKEFLYAVDGYNFPRPGYHPNCRSATTYILADEYRVISDEGQTRPSVINGKARSVDATENWYDLAKQYPSLAEQSLTPSKLKVFNAMSADDFVKAAYSNIGTPLTVEQMIASNNKVASILSR